MRKPIIAASCMLVSVLSYSATPGNTFKPEINLTNKTEDTLYYFLKGYKPEIGAKKTPGVLTTKNICENYSPPSFAYTPFEKDTIHTVVFSPYVESCLYIGKEFADGSVKKIGFINSTINWQKETIALSGSSISSPYQLSFSPTTTSVSGAITKK